MSAAQLHLVEDQHKVPSRPKAKESKPRAKRIGKSPPPAKVTRSRSESAASSPDSSARPPTRVKSSASVPKLKKRETSAADVMSRPGIGCSMHATLNDAVRLMWEHDLGCIVIVDETGVPTGTLTDRDACMAAYTQGVALFHGSIGSAMSKRLVTCAENTPVSEIRELMARFQIRRIVVVDHEGKVSGVVGLSDLIAEANGSLPKERKRGSTGPMLLNLMDAVLTTS